MAWTKSRALLVISELDHRGLKELAPLYEKIEDLAWRVPSQLALMRSVYSQMVLLRDQDATIEGAQLKLVAMVQDKTIDQVDVILGVHGLPDKIAFYDGSLLVSEWVRALKRKILAINGEINQFEKLGFLYNLSCFGMSHIQSFLDLGFKVVVGSRKVNANAEVEYPWVLENLAMGFDVASAFRVPNSPKWIKMADGPIRWIGRKQGNFLEEVDSYKMIGGQNHYRIVDKW